MESEYHRYFETFKEHPEALLLWTDGEYLKNASREQLKAEYFQGVGQANYRLCDLIMSEDGIGDFDVLAKA